MGKGWRASLRCAQGRLCPRPSSSSPSVAADLDGQGLAGIPSLRSGQALPAPFFQFTFSGCGPRWARAGGHPFAAFRAGSARALLPVHLQWLRTSMGKGRRERDAPATAGETPALQNLFPAGVVVSIGPPPPQRARRPRYGIPPIRGILDWELEDGMSPAIAY
jgi:hypothetical protein